MNNSVHKDQIVYNSDNDIIRQIKLRVIRHASVGILIPFLFSIYMIVMLRHTDYQHLLFAPFAASFLLLIGLFAIILWRQLKKYRPITITLNQDSVIMDGPVSTSEFQYAHISAIQAKPNQDSLKKIKIKTPYSQGYLHSVQNMSNLYQNLTQQIQAKQTFDTTQSDTEARNSHKRINKIRLILNGVLSIPSLFITFRLVQLWTSLETDFFLSILRITAYLFIYLYFSMNMLFSLYTRKIYNKLKNQWISIVITITIYLGLVVYILIHTGPILWSVLLISS